MENLLLRSRFAFLLLSLFTLSFASMACDSDPAEDDDDDDDVALVMHAAFSDFDEDNVTVYIEGQNFVIESNGLPNHTSPYWSSPFHAARQDGPRPTEAHPLFVEPTVTSYDRMAPGYIDDFNGMYSLTVDGTPAKASNTSSTGLGPIGIAVSGSMIYNDEEGPGRPIDEAAGSLDYTAAHTGPTSYHYHLETKAWSTDDNALIGIIADGFFLYGRKCESTGTDAYPSGLDASGGHTSITQHATEAEYHYHVQNELYANQYYLLFPGDYQGSPSSIQ